MAEVVDIRELNERIERQSAFVTNITTGMDQVIVGQKHLVESLLIGLLSDGHVLLEGVPGLAKTLAIKTLASLIDAQYSRIQFTPDLLPADVLGTMISAKVQSALLEAMQERQVTIGNETFRLPEPFLVMATQNPIEQEGTYPLPEAQVDRFMLKVVIDYPKLEEEKQIIRQTIAGFLSENAEDFERIYTLEILNGTTVQDLARRTSELYQGFGYDVVRVANAPDNDYAETVIIDRIGGSPVVNAIAQIIQCSNIQNGSTVPETETGEGSDGTEYAVDFTIILGSDFNGRYVIGSE